MSLKTAEDLQMKIHQVILRETAEDALYAFSSLIAAIIKSCSPTKEMRINKLKGLMQSIEKFIQVLEQSEHKPLH